MGWFTLHNPSLSEKELTRLVGEQLAIDLSLRPLQGQQKAFQARSFWEERGLIERISTGTESTFTFIYKGFQEFATANYLVQLAKEEFVEWIRSKRNLPEFKETILFTGGTERLPLTTMTLLDLDDPNNPVSTDAILASDVLAESENPPLDLQQQVFSHLAPRLTSNVPMVVYETGEKICPLALLRPTLIGPLALELAKHSQQWTREVGCALGLLAGEPYIDLEALLECV